ncbi:MAG: YggS family pyridoxal phosphate-dependent enzyme [Acidobacteriota bacterium]
MTVADAVTRPTTVAERLAEVRQRLHAACGRVGRQATEVTLVGVTKTVEVDRIREALDAGLSHLGESRFQEAIPKMRELADRAPLWHFIGRLQGNKARKVTEIFDRVESLDSLELARKLSSAAEEIGRELHVFVQVNPDEEASKGGLLPADLPAFLDEVTTLPCLDVTGLMAIPARRDDTDATRRVFGRVREMFEIQRQRHPQLRHLSLGMSADFDIAIEEGATEVRVGRALFGERG